MTTSDTLSDNPTSNDSRLNADAAQALDRTIAQAGPSWLEQDEVLRRLWADNKAPEEIATELGRSVAAIMTRAARLGLPRRMAPGRKRGYKRADKPRKLPPAGTARVRVSLPAFDEEHEQPVKNEAASRVCLMCLSKFQSLGRHNRICPTCKGSAEYATGSSTPDFSFKVVS